MKKATFALLALLASAPFATPTLAATDTSVEVEQDASLTTESMSEEQAYQAWAE